ncbi:MAG TPA: GntR family transcriptional regulator [Phaeodactylibacter sp.]|nr:GntR family transcriptional regulator [Phaeodactylibacter sp.]
MLQLGKYNSLKAFRETDNGVYLQDAQGNEVLLPNKYVPEDLEMGQHIEVFLFTDHEDRYTATTQKPKIQVHQFAYLQVVEVNDYGAFLDWGLDKHLLVPFSRQETRMKAGDSYLVCMYVDELTDRLVASAKMIQYFKDLPFDLEQGQEVQVLIGDETDIGYKVIVNQSFPGLIYKNETFKEIKPGDTTTGYLHHIRDDGKLDIRLHKSGYAAIPEHAQVIMKKLNEQNGFLPLNDKSSPEEISRHLQMSKKVFKKAIGGLYKARMIRIEREGIYTISQVLKK